MRRFFDLAVMPAGDGAFAEKDSEQIINNLSSMLSMASKLGIDGVGVVFNFSRTSEVKKARKMLEECKSNANPALKCWMGACIQASSEKELKRNVDKLKKRVDFVVVKGGEVTINRVACSHPWVDLLLDPHAGRKDSGMDHVMAKLAAEFNVGIASSFKCLLDAGSKKMSHILQHIKRNIILCEKYGASFILVSGATNPLEMRDGRALASLASVLGVRQDRALAFVSENPEKMLKAAAWRRNPSLIIPGVKIVKRGEKKNGKA